MEFYIETSFNLFLYQNRDLHNSVNNGTTSGPRTEDNVLDLPTCRSIPNANCKVNGRTIKLETREKMGFWRSMDRETS